MANTMHFLAESLEISWENEAQLPERPLYSLHFSAQRNPVRSAQPEIYIAGVESLASYLRQIGFTPDEAMEVLGLIQRLSYARIPKLPSGEKLVA